MNPPDSLAIEVATQADIESIADDWVALARDQRRHGSHVLAEPNRETMRNILAAHRVDDGLLVARLEGSIVGFVSVSLERGSLELDATRGLLSNIYVVPEYRGRDIGSALLRAAERSLADRGVDVVVLEAMAANDRARRFYERHGYDVYRVGMERELEDDRTAESACDQSGMTETENDTHSKDDR